MTLAQQQKASEIGIPVARRHIFLCADQTTPKCCDKERGIAAWDFLKRRLKEIGLSEQGGILRTKANCLRICEGGPIAVVYPEGAWYRECLGLDADENGLWSQETGPTVFATFEAETGYFGSRAQQTMLNFRVRDLDAMLAQLRAKGADVAEETQDMEGVGRFGWVTDPEGNRVELWQPA